MASSGSFLTNGWYSSGKGDYIYLEFAWSVTDTSVEKNQKTIYWELRGKRTASGYATSGPFEVTIDGEVKTYDSRINLYNGTVVASGNKTFTHKSDGTRSFDVSVRGGVYYSDINTCTGSKTFTLDTIPRASAITSAANVTLGNKCSVKWTPLAASFRYKLKFSLGKWNSGEIGPIHPNTTSAYTYTGYTIPLEVAEQIPNSSTETMKVTLYSYSDSGATSQIGSSDDETFTITVPTSAGPKVSMALSPEHSLPSAFDDVYVQGHSRVKADLSAEGKYKATIKSYDVTVRGKTYGSSANYTSDYLTKTGSFSVVGRAVDSRQNSGSAEQSITVTPYTNPKILNATAQRCDKNGNVSDDGAYLKITAKRSYAPVVANGVQKNFCAIRYRYKEESASSYSEWETILPPDDLSTDEVVTGPLLEGALLATSSYLVEVQAIDDVGKPATSEVIVSTEKVYWHRDGAKNALGLGKYNERENALDSAWDFFMNGHMLTGLPDPVDGTDPVTLNFLKSRLETGLLTGDANDVIYTAFLRATDGATNCPSANGFLLAFSPYPGQMVFQIGCDYGGDSLQYRVYWFGTWYPWKAFS